MIDTAAGHRQRQHEGADHDSPGVVGTGPSGWTNSTRDLLAAPGSSASYLAGSGRAPLPCQSHDPEIFFAESPRDVQAAKTLCATCPVRELCLAGARDRREPWGVWGGELFKDGLVIAYKRPRGRPRKHAA